MRIWLNNSPKGHERKGHPYMDINPSIHGVNILFSEDGYCITRREEISNAEIVRAINEILRRPASERKF